MKKNIENSEAPTRIPTTLAPVIVRMRKIENGTSGARERRSMKTKAISSSAARDQGADRLGRAPAGAFGVEQGEDEGREAER